MQNKKRLKKVTSTMQVLQVGKISSLMGDVAKGIKSFKKGMSSEDNNKENIDSPENKDEDSESQNK